MYLHTSKLKTGGMLIVIPQCMYPVCIRKLCIQLKEMQLKYLTLSYPSFTGVLKKVNSVMEFALSKVLIALVSLDGPFNLASSIHKIL